MFSLSTILLTSDQYLIFLSTALHKALSIVVRSDCLYPRSNLCDGSAKMIMLMQSMIL